VSLQNLLSFCHASCGTYLDAFADEKALADKGLTPVLFGSHYTISPLLFDRAALDFPMRQYSWCTGVGRTCVDIYRILETADSQRSVLVTGVTRTVCMDFARRISVPFPDCESRRISPTLPPGACRFPFVNVPESAPVGAFSAVIKVRHDDMDFNWHSNQASYTAFALECAAQAAAAGRYSRIRDDIAFYRALSLTCVHLGESFAGDELNVSTWEDVDNAMLLHFLVHRQRQRISYIKTAFDENVIASKL